MTQRYTQWEIRYGGQSTRTQKYRDLELPYVRYRAQVLRVLQTGPIWIQDKLQYIKPDQIYSLMSYVMCLLSQRGNDVIMLHQQCVDQNLWPRNSFNIFTSIFCRVCNTACVGHFILAKIRRILAQLNLKEIKPLKYFKQTLFNPLSMHEHYSLNMFEVSSTVKSNLR